MELYKLLGILSEVIKAGAIPDTPIKMFHKGALEPWKVSHLFTKPEPKPSVPFVSPLPVSCTNSKPCSFYLLHFSFRISSYSSPKTSMKRFYATSSRGTGLK